ncbi:Aste57867_15033 [Aphanomyces stellatus]|uniref:Aste57867_15033 protein n=1 Tax=Aphanomyces stellatus TaxID=120398 RepID=A0A485L3G6_9STRA|nr:hypothetical protein As57867_014977 [Aphanomyces stellatus]VFT91847.1 Aste57867_15033 [Aphanomyces stellatus]
MYAPPSAGGGALTALEHAVALPDAFSKQEYERILRRNHQDVTKAAVQLKAKHAWMQSNDLDNLGLGKPSIQREVKKQYMQVLHEATDKVKCPVVLFSVGKFHVKQTTDAHLIAGKEQCTDHGGSGSAVDAAASSLEDARRLIVYMVTLAVELMEDENAPGIVFLIDMEGVSTNLVVEGSVHLELLKMLKEHFPETVQFCFVLNFSASVWVQQATAFLLKSLGVSNHTQQKIKFVQDLRELHHYFNAPSLPEKFGGLYRLMLPQQWMEVQAEIEDIDLDNLPADEETVYMTKQARELNGMQYAACSVNQVVEMNTTVLRGPLWRNKSGIAWVKVYAVLRPDALLLYDDAKGKMPMVIIPVNHEVAVVAAHFDNAPKGTFGFRVDVEGVPGGHLLAANSEKERGNWLQDLQMGIQSFQELHAREVYDEERKMKLDADFEKLNMIDFSTELPTQPVTRPLPPPASPPAPTPIINAPPYPALQPGQHGMMMPPPLMMQTPMHPPLVHQSMPNPMHVSSPPAPSPMNMGGGSGFPPMMYPPNGMAQVPPQGYGGYASQPQGLPPPQYGYPPQMPPHQPVYGQHAPPQMHNGVYQPTYTSQQQQFPNARTF